MVILLPGHLVEFDAMRQPFNGFLMVPPSLLTNQIDDTAAHIGARSAEKAVFPQVEKQGVRIGSGVIARTSKALAHVAANLNSQFHGHLQNGIGLLNF
jgi:hypothetical protein